MLNWAEGCTPFRHPKEQRAGHSRPGRLGAGEAALLTEPETRLRGRFPSPIEKENGVVEPFSFLLC
jgi:hypothetical protein